MPSGKTHTRINFISLPAILIALMAWGLTSTSFYLFFALGFVVGTYLITPDMDTRSDSYRRWGIFRFIWYPYMRSVSHRSPISHTLILGDVFRLVYLTTILSPLLIVINKYLLDDNILFYIETYKFQLLSVVIGIMAASAMHIIADNISTKRKRLATKRRKRRKKK